MEIFEGPSYFFVDDSNHDRATSLLEYLNNNAQKCLDITVSHKYIINNLHKNLSTLITNYRTADKFMIGLAEKDAKKWQLHEEAVTIVEDIK